MTMIKTECKNLLIVSSMAMLLILAGCKKKSDPVAPNTPIAPIDQGSNQQIKDIDGNVYTSVKIGKQIWMVENLNVTKFRDGTPIPEYDSFDFPNDGTIGYLYYLNAMNPPKLFGKLYNYSTIVDPRGLAPVGWHIPTKAEWDSLDVFLDPVNPYGWSLTAGGMLKDTGTTYWDAPNTNATNSFGFTALPAGMFDIHQGFFSAADGFWWSRTITPYDLTQVHIRSVSAINGVLSDNTRKKNCGISVRCIKD